MAKAYGSMRGTTMRFVLNPQGLAELANRNQTGVAMQAIGSVIADRAMANGGRFTRGYEVQSESIEMSKGVRVGTAFSMAHFDEWGTIYRPPRAPLRRALGSLGLLSKTKMKGKS